MAAQTIYALLVGIDHYPIAAHCLRGCVNDTQAFEDFLRQRCASEQTTLEIKKLTDGQATRQAIVDGFLNHLAQAGPADTVLFYYSGHGAQEPAPTEFWYAEPDRLCETLVCADSRLPGGGGAGDLTDKELGFLLWQAGQRNPHVVAILDCCHSGSGTRGESEGVRVRQIPQVGQARPIESYLGFAHYRRLGNELHPPTGSHVLLAAAESRQLAKEARFGDQDRGAFNYALIDTLANAKRALSYAELMSQVRGRVISLVADQAPQLELIKSSDPGRGSATSLDHSFLGGTVLPKPDYLSVQHVKGEWQLNAGRVHGIPPVVVGNPTVLAIYPPEASAADLLDLGRAVGQVEVLDVFADHAKVMLRNGDPTLVYKAKIKQIGREPIKFYVEGDAQLVAQLRQAYDQQHTRSVYYKLTDERAAAKYRVLARGGQYAICGLADERPLAQPLPADRIGAGHLLGDLETVAKWELTLAVQNPDTSFQPSDVKLEMFEVFAVDGYGNFDAADQAPEPLDAANGVRIYYQQNHRSEWEPRNFVLRVTNRSHRDLYCAMLYMDSAFGIDDSFFPTQLIPAGGEGFIDQKRAVTLAVDERLAANGVLEETFFYKLVFSTVEFKSDVYRQDPLPLPQEKSQATRGMRRIEPPKDQSDWATYELAVTVVRPPSNQPISNQETVELLGLKIHPHGALQARAGLLSLGQATRDLNGTVPVAPAVLAELPAGSTAPVQLTPGHRQDPGLSLLELSGVADKTAVTHANPLILELPTQLAEDEIIMPLATDGEFFYPVGGTVRLADGRFEVHIEELPDETPTEHNGQGQTRSLGGSIKILFQKFVYQRVGLPFEYPILAQATFADEGDQLTVVYQKAPGEVKLAVGQARSILVYVHGIIGDTKDMAKSIRLLGPEWEQKYDLVLTFDYENLNTTIDQNAKLLAQRLADVGLGPGHGKTLHVLAHSMGGLVSRFFIEKLGGHQVVSHLVMLGTPNAGSPIANVKEWASLAVSALLSKVSLGAWGLAPAVWLWNKAMQEAGVALAQLKPGSDFLTGLNTGAPDPGIPYTVVAGNTRKIPQATLNALYAKLKNVTDEGLRWLFAGDNDLAVSVVSIKQVLNPANLAFIDADCDHCSYFTSPEGLAALRQALQERVWA
ncbi:MAG: caspase family protein [Bernardetiaceae bacterium]|jgi:pimeloyl-ACP methyl ester carboxylesterase|nr:caspase family protein [Bernardetiaceae bacterium]